MHHVWMKISTEQMEKTDRQDNWINGKKIERTMYGYMNKSK